MPEPSMRQHPDRLRALRAFGWLGAAAGDLLSALTRGEPPPLLEVRRAAQELAWLPERTIPILLGLVQVTADRADLTGRCSRIGLICLLVGRQAELSRTDRRDLVVAAVTSQIGRLARSDLTHASAAQVGHLDAHSGGMSWLTASSAPGRGATLRLIVSTDLDRSEGRRRGHPASRIVAAAEAFDRLTASPAGEGRRPSSAYHFLLEQADLDPGAVQLVARTFGLVPAGSLVRLHTGELAAVTRAGGRLGLAGATLAVVTDADGRPRPARRVGVENVRTAIMGTVEPDPEGKLARAAFALV